MEGKGSKGNRITVALVGPNLSGAARHRIDHEANQAGHRAVDPVARRKAAPADHLAAAQAARRGAARAGHHAAAPAARHRAAREGHRAVVVRVAHHAAAPAARPEVGQILRVAHRAVGLALPAQAPIVGHPEARAGSTEAARGSRRLRRWKN
jgi:hypothetical protein